jgi:glycolate oxidase FAD binding subunit
VTIEILHIDGCPVPEAGTPESEAELAGLMKEAWNDRRTMAAIGGATQLHLGNRPRPVQLALHTRRLRGIVEYEPDNLTVSVRAGTPLLDLQQTLAGQNQFLPLDPPGPAHATLGGLVATNTSGPIRFHYGTIRDLLIGISIVHADGTRTKAGGKLVKNVSGYDMCKLYTGSLGTLGIFTELTFKVQPKSEAIATIMVGYESLAGALEATQAFLRADLMPDAIEAFNGTAYAGMTGETPHAPWILALRFGETDTAVRWQADRLRQLVPAGGGSVFNAIGNEESEGFWQKASSAREDSVGSATLLLKCSALYQSLPEMERRMTEIGARLQAQTALFCHAGTYILYGRYEWPAGACRQSPLLREIIEFRRYAVSVGGHLVVEKIQPEWKEGFDVWGYEAPAVELMRRIKKQFDPKGLLNPGRFVGGL